MSKQTAPRPRESSSPYVVAVKATAGVVTVLALVGFLVAARAVLLLLLVSFILAIGLQPSRKWLERRGLSPRWTTALIILIEATVAALLAVVVVPTVIQELGQLVEQAPESLRQQEGSTLLGGLVERFDLARRADAFAARLPEITESLAPEIATVVFALVTVLILTTYFTVGMPRIQKAITRVLWREDQEHFETILDRSTERVSGYIRGNLLISLIAGVTSFLALLIIGVPSPAGLAFFVALTDLIPLVGAFVGAAAATAAAATFAGTVQMVATAIFFLVYQQVENYVIQPWVMRNTIEMSAAAVIVAVLVGGSVLGITGALLALPVAAIAKVVIENLFVEERVDKVGKENPPG